MDWLSHTPDLCFVLVTEPTEIGSFATARTRHRRLSFRRTTGRLKPHVLARQKRPLDKLLNRYGTFLHYGAQSKYLYDRGAEPATESGPVQSL